MSPPLPAGAAAPGPTRLLDLRLLGDQAFSRAAGAPLVPGNRVELLLDARENYPAWRRAIERATRTVHFEMYIFHDDPTGRAFADLLIRRAREGVRVRVLYDWLGALGKTPAHFWRRLREGGVEVRCGNPPRLDNPLAWVRRDHRKLLVVDGRVAFVSGLCIGQDWVGWPERGIEPWRDTGVSVRGPAVADLERAFADAWATAGEPIPEPEVPRREDLAVEGSQALRVIASTPETTGLLRLDLLWAALARHRLWLTDAYFVGTWSYLAALRAAAEAGVDVRLLVPSGSDIELVAMLSRTQYRPLLEAGVRVFEWNGSMVHAKSAVIDGRWARVGSTNLNLASWVGNWEIDVCVEDEPFAAALEDAYERDLAHATEIVLEASRRPLPATERPPPPRRRRRAPGSASRAAAAALELGHVVGAAIAQRDLGAQEARALSLSGGALAVLAVLALVWPYLLALPLALLGGWLGVSLLARAQRIRREARAGPSPSRRRPD